MPKPWIGTHSEAEVIRATVAGVAGDPLERRRWNVDGILARPTAEDFWKSLVLSLLSSQQRYAENSPIWRLENGIDEFPLPFRDFSSLEKEEIDRRLGQFRFHQRITGQLIANFHWLSGDEQGSKAVQQSLDILLLQRNSFPLPNHWKAEREVAVLLADNLKGVGPKQARNLLQSLGLTRYEIPSTAEWSVGFENVSAGTSEWDP